jgi:DNA-binding response OmpR family regulator
MVEYNRFVCNNGQEGLDVFKTNKIDIVLMDSNAGYGRL